MQKAYDPVDKKNLTVKQYVDQEGPKFDNRAVERQRRKMICSVCEGEAHTIAEDNLNRSATWGHDPAANVFCPVKNSGRKRYDELPPGAVNEEAGELLRSSFLAHWKWHWSHVCDLAEHADILSFIEFIGMMDVRNIWNRVGLLEWQIPYIFLVSMDFPPPKPKKGKMLRKEWYRFTLEPRIRTFADLWIDAHPATYINRMSYRKPRKGEPESQHYLFTDAIQFDTTFLAKPESTLYIHPFAAKKMREKFGI